MRVDRTHRGGRRALAVLATGVLAGVHPAACYGGLPSAPPGPTTDATPLDVGEVAEGGTLPITVDPGRVTLHRLNRTEYDRTVHDLLGTKLTPALDFPPDDTGYGFDNIADVLSISPLYLEMAERAAGTLIEDALREPLYELADLILEAELAEEKLGLQDEDVGVMLFAPDHRVGGTLEVPESGTWTLSIDAWAAQAGDEVVRARLFLGALEVGEVEVEASEETPGSFGVEVEVDWGPTSVAVELANPSPPNAGLLRSLTVDRVHLVGPKGLVPPGPDWVSPRERLLICDPDATGPGPCARTILEAFTPKAWRRPVTTEEIDGLITLFEAGSSEGMSFEEALGFSLRAVLISVHFLFRVEIDEAPTSPEAHLLGDHELASRLSYFLWSSMPDEALLEAAGSGGLHDPEVLADQVERMLADPRSSSLVEHFAGQWLAIRGLEDIAPDPWIFPEFDEELRASMREEMRLFFATFLEEDRPVVELLTAKDTYLDDRLAAHYELEPPGGGFVRVWDAPDRGGLLRQGGLLAVTSYPTRTSPVKRGAWVLDHLLCDPPPPPPAGVEGLIEEAGAEGAPRSLRERLAKHREDPMCASCHALMDPIGFGLEPYDALGRWREEDAGVPIEAAGELLGAGPFEGTEELIALLAADPRLLRCAADRLTTFGIGRGLEVADREALDQVEEAFAAGGHTFRALIGAVVNSDLFRARRGEPGAEIEAGKGSQEQAP